MRKALRAGVLVLTALALVATSKGGPPPSCPEGPLVPGPTLLQVESTCGPAGAVTATVDPEVCTVALDGAAAVGLPASGRVDGRDLHLDDGSARHCDGVEETPGAWRVRCYDRHDGGGCGGADLPACDAVLTVAAP